MRIDLLITSKTVKRKKLKFGLNMGNNECVMCAIFWDPRLRDRESKQKKHKKCDFWLENLLIRL